MVMTASNPDRSTPAMQTSLPAVGDVLAIVGSPRDAASYVSSRLAARTNGSVTGCSMSAAFLGHAAPKEPTVMALLDQPPAARRRDDLASGGDGDQFMHLARTAGVHDPQWAVIENDAAGRLASLSAWHDLVVVQRPADLAANPLDGLNHLLLGTGLPCLVLPEICAPCGVFDNVMLAWDGSVPSTRAIRAALPLVVAAQRVCVLDGAEPHAVTDGVPGFDPMAFLARHGVEVTHKRLHATPSSAGAAILDRARRFKAELLVMGAYGHTPLRERLLGGATRHVLTHGTIATLLCH